MNKKRILAILIMAAVMLAASTEVCMAKTTRAYINTNRTSNTKATVIACASFSRIASYASCTMNLKEYYKGKWRTPSDVKAVTVIRKEYNEAVIFCQYCFTLKKGKIYKVNTTFLDKKGSSICKRLMYSPSF